MAETLAEKVHKMIWGGGQLDAMARDIVRVVIEEAAKVAEDWDPKSYWEEADPSASIAAAIRGLAE